MIFHPSTIFFTFWLVMSIYLSSCLDSLLLIWLMLEINLLSFLPLLITKTKNSSESAMKYFLVQSISSLIIIVMMTIPMSLTLAANLLMASILIKLGAAPFHQWVSPVFTGVSWYNIFILSSIQKIIPLSLMVITQISASSIWLLMTSVIISLTVGATGGLFQNSMQKILAFSSISHMAWMMIPSYFNNTMWFLYLSLYSAVMFMLIWWLDLRQIFSLSQMFALPFKKESVLTSMNLLSLAGMPPLTGFAPKLAMLQEIYYSPLKMMIAPLILSTLVSMMFYLRVMILSVLTNSSSLRTSWGPVFSSKWMFFNSLGLTAAPVIMFFILSKA